MDPVEIITGLKLLIGLVSDLAQAMKELHHGDPDKVDLDELIKRLEELPELPTDE